MKLLVVGLSIMFSLVSVSYGMTPIEFGKSVGANKNLINELQDACQVAKDPIHCFGIGLAISKAESQMGTDPTSHGYFGRVGSLDKSSKGFVGTYKRKYYIVDKYNEGGMFYGYGPGKPAPTSYCMSEAQPDGTMIYGYCPHGRKNFNTIYSSYKIKVMNKKYNPPLDEGISDETHKKECRYVGNAKKGDYIQLDSRLGVLLEIFGIKNDSKVFICSN